MKLKTKKWIIIASIIVLVVVALFIIKISSTEKEKGEKVKKSNFTEIIDKSKSDTKNDGSKEEEQEISDESKTDNSSSKSTNSSNVNNESTVSDNNTANNKSTVSSSTNSSVPQISTPQPDPTPSQNTQPVQTEWEKLGISQYEYYHTPMNAGEEVVFEGNESLCTTEINRLVDKYYREGLSGGNSYTINGKYTYSYIGCGINIYINNVKYKYSQVKAMGYN